jgi:cell division protein FtsB
MRHYDGKTCTSLVLASLEASSAVEKEENKKLRQENAELKQTLKLLIAY